jgi:hypothetical protein
VPTHFIKGLGVVVQARRLPPAALQERIGTMMGDLLTPIKGRGRPEHIPTAETREEPAPSPCRYEAGCSLSFTSSCHWPCSLPGWNSPGETAGPLL